MRLLTPLQAAEVLQLSPWTLAQWRHQGRGPAFVRLGRLVRYRQEDLTQYVEGSLTTRQSSV
jgi:excisionase family DNA binding protein